MFLPISEQRALSLTIAVFLNSASTVFRESGGQSDLVKSRGDLSESATAEEPERDSLRMKKKIRAKRTRKIKTRAEISQGRPLKRFKVLSKI